MPVLDARALDIDPEGMRLLDGVLRPNAKRRPLHSFKPAVQPVLVVGAIVSPARAPLHDEGKAPILLPAIAAE